MADAIPALPPAGDTMKRWTLAVALSAAALLAGERALAQKPGNAPVIASNDNSVPAGRLENGVLTLRLEARGGWWYPAGASGDAYPIAAFAEAGGRLLNPGPTVRVPVGTKVRVSVRNTLLAPLRMFGLGGLRPIVSDSVIIAPGATAEMEFTATAPGTYFYAGRTDTSERGLFGRRGEDSQLNGVIIVDAPETPRRANERVFVLSWWLPDTLVSATADLSPVFVINGLSWPHTERFDVTQGDSLYWRWISMTAAPHPMHLHGFYFRVDARGSSAADTIFEPARRRMAVTEILRAGQTMAISWSPERPGNWLMHCHLAIHVTPGGIDPEEMNVRLATPVVTRTDHTDHMNHMAGLVVGVHVRPKGAQPTPPAHYRPLRLTIHSRPGAYGTVDGFAYALGDGAPRLPGPTLVLEKDEPVAITIVNRSHEAAAVHWHGIELESFPDGVPGWSGAGASLLPAIAPRDSLTVRFTPPRAGTFMYHSHFNELQQISTGLYGGIVVLERGQRFDSAIDRVLLFSDPGPARIDGVAQPPANALLNGQSQHESFALRAGQTHRLRIINIRSNPLIAVELRDGENVLEWRLVAKDGADVPPSHAVAQTALLILGPGEIYDVEFTPKTAGTLQLRYGFPAVIRPPAQPPRVPLPVVLPPAVAVTVQVR
jgi:FtsP/CotA-like multicopper oxidase with cupredoxin domain